MGHPQPNQAVERIGHTRGTTHWNRGVLRALLVTEALRTAMGHFGHQPMTGAQVQWGLEPLTLTPAYEGTGDVTTAGGAGFE